MGMFYCIWISFRLPPWKHCQIAVSNRNFYYDLFIRILIVIFILFFNILYFYIIKIILLKITLRPSTSILQVAMRIPSFATQNDTKALLKDKCNCSQTTVWRWHSINPTHFKAKNSGNLLKKWGHLWSGRFILSIVSMSCFLPVIVVCLAWCVLYVW